MADKKPGNGLLNFLILVSGVTLALKLTYSGKMTVDLAAIFLFLVVVSVAIKSTWIKVILPIAGLVFFMLDVSAEDTTAMAPIIAGIGALLLAMYGIYLIIKQLF